MKTKPKAKAEKPPEKPSKTFERLAKEARRRAIYCAEEKAYGMAEHYMVKHDTYLGAASIARSYGA